MKNKLQQIKILHTIIWLFFVTLISYTLYAGIANKINIYVFIAISFVILEGIILLYFKGECPLTIIARKYTKNREPNFDIFLPKWIAKHNKIIFSTIFVLSILIITYRLIF